MFLTDSDNELLRALIGILFYVLVFGAVLGVILNFAAYTAEDSKGDTASTVQYHEETEEVVKSAEDKAPTIEELAAKTERTKWIAIAVITVVSVIVGGAIIVAGMLLVTVLCKKLYIQQRQDETTLTLTDEDK